MPPSGITKPLSRPGPNSRTSLIRILERCYNVALIYRKTGRQKAAEPYYLHALEIYEKQLGPDHPDVASVLNNLAVFYTNERRFAEAEKTHLRALAIREKFHPPTHPDIAQSKCKLAVVYHSNGDYARASELYHASIKTWEAATD